MIPYFQLSGKDIKEITTLLEMKCIFNFIILQREKVSTNRVIRYYLLLFHDSLTEDSDIPEIEDENAFAFYGMKDAAFSLLNCMNSQLTEGESTFIVEKIINMLYKIHETRPKIVLHILSIFSPLSHSPRIYHLRAESNYYVYIIYILLYIIKIA